MEPIRVYRYPKDEYIYAYPSTEDENMLAEDEALARCAGFKELAEYYRHILIPARNGNKQAQIAHKKAEKLFQEIFTYTPTNVISCNSKKEIPASYLAGYIETTDIVNKFYCVHPEKLPNKPIFLLTKKGEWRKYLVRVGTCAFVILLFSFLIALLIQMMGG